MIFYNITKAKRALWLVDSASTICPWVYAVDVLDNYIKAKRALRDVAQQKIFCCSTVSMLCYKTNGKRHSVHYWVMDALGEVC